MTSVNPLPLLWLRDEPKSGERRTLVTPGVAASLVAAGYPLVVESSAARAFPIDDYASLGCRIEPSGAWREAPVGAVVLGLKELDASLGPFRHRHVHFAHVYKSQAGWRDVLRAFDDGGGSLYDLEYLVDEHGRRVAAFGYWAGFVGAALGLLALAARAEGGLLGPVAPWPDRGTLESDVRSALGRAAMRPRVLVIGASGRSGQGAIALCEAAGASVTSWDVDETRAGGPFEAVRDHDLLVNCVFVAKALPPFTTLDELARPGRRLGAIVDVSCDPHGDANALPIYTSPTTLDEPARRLQPGEPLDLVAIDHLPTLLPIESSEDFSGQMLPWLLNLRDEPRADTPWARARRTFEQHRRLALESFRDDASPGGNTAA